MTTTTAGARARRLRELVEAPGLLVVPGAQDCLSAMLVEEAGFDAFFYGDYNAAAVLLGKPDYGLVTVTEMAEAVRRMTAVVRIPLIADAGCGFGNPLNVMRAVAEYERAGVAAVTIEDQVYPKRCGHMEGKQVVATAEMEARIRAALRARENPDLMIIARTDAIATDGLDAAVERGKAYAAAGADAFWADAVATLDDLARLVRDVPLPVQVAMIEGGKTPHTRSADLERIGVAIELCGLTTLYAQAGGIRRALEALRRDGITTAALDTMVPFAQFNDFIGLAQMQALEREFITE